MKTDTFVPCSTPITQENYNKMFPFLESTGIKIHNKKPDIRSDLNAFLGNFFSDENIFICGYFPKLNEVSNFQFLINSGVELTLQDVCIEVNNDNRSEVIEFINETYPNDKVVSYQHISEVNSDLHLFFYEKDWWTQYGSGNKIQATIEEVRKYFGKPKLDEETKPKHYSKGIDTFSRMESNCTLEERLAFAKGNIDKYTWREKGQDKQDFEKIIKYAEWALKQLDNELGE